MSVVRGPRKEANWTPIDNAVLRNADLSLRARGLLGYLLSMPADWRINAESIARATKEGRDAVRGALRELKKFGYIVYEKIQDAVTGQWSTASTVYEVPVQVDGETKGAEPSVSPRPGKPKAGSPPVGNPGPTPRIGSQRKETNQPQAPEEASDSNAPASKLVVGESPTDKRLKELEEACRERALIPRFDLASPDKIDAVADLLNTFSAKEMADHALKMQTPGNPTRWLGGLLRIWQGMPQRKPVSTKSKYCAGCEDSFGWAGENEHGQMVRCACQTAVAA